MFKKVILNILCAVSLLTYADAHAMGSKRGHPLTRVTDFPLMHYPDTLDFERPVYRSEGIAKFRTCLNDLGTRIVELSLETMKKNGLSATLKPDSSRMNQVFSEKFTHWENDVVYASPDDGDGHGGHKYFTDNDFANHQIRFELKAENGNTVKDILVQSKRAKRIDSFSPEDDFSTPGLTFRFEEWEDERYDGDYSIFGYGVYAKIFGTIEFVDRKDGKVIAALDLTNVTEEESSCKFRYRQPPSEFRSMHRVH